MLAYDEGEFVPTVTLGIILMGFAFGTEGWSVRDLSRGSVFKANILR
jgi:hypothetical protein